MARTFNAFKDSRVQGAHDFGDGQCAPVPCRQAFQRGLGFRIKPPGFLGLETDEFEKLGAFFTLEKIGFGATETREVFQGQVEASLFSIASNVSKDVGELESHAEVDGIILGMG